MRGQQRMDVFFIWSVTTDKRLKQWFKVKTLHDAFVSYKHLASRFKDVNWWSEVVWISCVLLWCFYQLFGLSFWRHPFTAEDPLVSKWYNATILQIWSRFYVYIVGYQKIPKYPHEDCKTWNLLLPGQVNDPHEENGLFGLNNVFIKI